MVSRSIRALLVAGSLVAAGSASAASLEEYVTGWRLQNYQGGGVYVYFTSATACTSGQLGFGPNSTVQDRDRFWSLILTAKAANKKVGVFYSGSAASCTIDSFYLAENS